jgi:hypothetical protein
MRHETTDRVPLFYRDVPSVEQRLLNDLGLADREALLRYLDIDFRWVAPKYVGPPLELENGNVRNIWGVEFQYENQGRGGYWAVVEFPLKDAHDPAQLDDYPWPTLDLYDFSNLMADAAAHADYAVMTAPGVPSPGIMSVTQDLIGMERMLLDPLTNPAFYEVLIEKVLAFNVPFVERMFEAADGGIDFFRIGDDYGGQSGLLLSVDQWQQWYAPGQKAMSDAARKHGAWYYHHSCGGVRNLLPGFIDLGVDVLDPIQIQAVGMEPEALKRDFGDRLVFSGGIDEQQVLPHATPDEVAAEVTRMCDILGQNGGYFVGSTHNFQEDIPTENILAMYDAARNWKP